MSFGNARAQNYRTTKAKEIAVKTYTIGNESRHLIVENSPKFNPHEELVGRFAGCGQIDSFEKMTSLSSDPACEQLRISFKEIANARIAKKKWNKSGYLGQSLRVRYAPELETINDLREKVAERLNVVYTKVSNFAKQAEVTAKVNAHEALGASARSAAQPAHTNPSQKTKVHTNTPTQSYGPSQFAQPTQTPAPGYSYGYGYGNNYAYGYGYGAGYGYPCPYPYPSQDPNYGAYQYTPSPNFAAPIPSPVQRQHAVVLNKKRNQPDTPLTATDRAKMRKGSHQITEIPAKK